MAIAQTDKIAVIGAGTMGAGIAQAAATAGHRVVVIDSNGSALPKSSEGIGKALATAMARGILPADEAEAINARIHWSSDLEDAADAVLVVEAIAERLDVKIGLFTQLASIVGSGAVLASNTSSLSIEAMADGVTGPERFIGLHFFNPAAIMKLVEVVPSSRTEPAIADALSGLMRAWGKRPVVVADVPGFIVNRVARPYYAEGFAALSEGIAPATVDRALTSCGGFRTGPLTLADLIGHDVNYEVARSIYDAYRGATRFRPQEAQRVLVESGRLGRKSGGGVFGPEGVPPPVFAQAGPAPQSIRIAASGGTSVKLFREAGLVCHEDADLPHGFVNVDGVRFAMTDGRPLSRRDDVDVLADIARDFAAANTIILTANNADNGMAVAGLVQATGRSALFIPDRPGMLVLRTLAQLANAAADAAADGVASIGAIDEALVYGASHPEGPLHWAEHAGLQRVATALANIAEATGDEMYRPAALLAAQ